MAFDKVKVFKHKPDVVEDNKVKYISKQKNAQGQKELIALLTGKPINLRGAIKAKCYDCMGYYSDGISDCNDFSCPLHPFMPYNPNKPILRAKKAK